MMTGCSLRLKTNTRSAESVATPATSPWLQPDGSCSQSGTSSKVNVLSPTSMRPSLFLLTVSASRRLRRGRFTWNRTRSCPMADIDDQAFGRLELGLVVHVTQANRVQLNRPRGEQALSGCFVVRNRHADMYEPWPRGMVACAQAKRQQRQVDVAVRQVDG